MKSCYFADSKCAVPFDKVDTKCHRKIVSYKAHADRKPDADIGSTGEPDHGTHTDGIVAGVPEGATDGSVATGLAWGAKLAFFDLGKGGEGLDVPQDVAGAYLQWGLWEPLQSRLCAVVCVCVVV